MLPQMPKSEELGANPYKRISTDRIKFSTEHSLLGKELPNHPFNLNSKGATKHSTKSSNLALALYSHHKKTSGMGEVGSQTDRSLKTTASTSANWYQVNQNADAPNARLAKLPPTHMAFCNPLMGKNVKSEFFVTAVATPSEPSIKLGSVFQKEERYSHRRQVTLHSISTKTETKQRAVTLESERSTKQPSDVYQPPVQQQESVPVLGISNLFEIKHALGQQAAKTVIPQNNHKIEYQQRRFESTSQHFSRGPSVGLSVPNLPMFTYYHVERKLRGLQSASRDVGVKDGSFKMKIDRVQEESLGRTEQEGVGSMNQLDTSNTILSLLKATGGHETHQNSSKKTDSGVRHVKSQKPATQFGSNLSSKYKNSKSVVNFQIKLAKPNGMRSVQLINLEQDSEAKTNKILPKDIQATESKGGYEEVMQKQKLEEEYKERVMRQKESPKMKVLSCLQSIRDLLKCLLEIYRAYQNPNISEDQYLKKVGEKLSEQLQLGLPSDSPLKTLFLTGSSSAFPEGYFTLSRIFKMFVRPNTLLEKFKPVWTKQGQSESQPNHFMTPIKILNKLHSIDLTGALTDAKYNSALKKPKDISHSYIDSYQDFGTGTKLKVMKAVSFLDLDTIQQDPRVTAVSPPRVLANSSSRDTLNVSRDRQTFSRDNLNTSRDKPPNLSRGDSKNYTNPPTQKSLKEQPVNLRRTNSKLQMPQRLADSRVEEYLCPADCTQCQSLGGDRTFCTWLQGLEDYNIVEELLHNATNIEFDPDLLRHLDTFIKNLTVHVSGIHSVKLKAVAKSTHKLLSAMRGLTAQSLTAKKPGLVVAGHCQLEGECQFIVSQLHKREMDIERREHEIAKETNSQTHVWQGARDKIRGLRDIRSLIAKGIIGSTRT